MIFFLANHCHTAVSIANNVDTEGKSHKREGDHTLGIFFLGIYFFLLESLL